MKSGNACLVFLLLQLCILDSRATEETLGRHQHESNAIPSHAQTVDHEHKLMADCQHSDYRTYIKCLKREKRQHHGLGNSRCLDECFEQNCTTSACIRDCHSHCKKRLIETYSKTVETSYDCSDGTCTENKPGTNVPNITAHIHITNVLPNVTTNCKSDKDATTTTESTGCTGTSSCNKPTCTGGTKSPDAPRSPCDGGGGGSGGSGGCKDSKDVVPKIDIHNVINNQYGQGPSGSDCACPGCNCNQYNPYNSWQAMPQITIGIGGGPMGGGCMFPASWPCFQRFQAPPVDCSTCSNPFLRYHCDPACYPARNGTQNTTQRPPSTTQWNSNYRRSY